MFSVPPQVRDLGAACVFAVAVLLAAPRPGAAQEAEEEGHAVPHHALSNEIALFVGNTRKEGGDALTFGLDYVRELNPRFGTGVFFDWATNHAERSFIVGIPLYVETGLGHLVVTVGPGIERETEVGDDPEEAEEGHGESGDVLFLFRLGAQYGFHFGAGGRFVIAPQTNLDLTKRENAWVLGAIVGVAF